MVGLARGIAGQDICVSLGPQLRIRITTRDFSYFLFLCTMIAAGHGVAFQAWSLRYKEGSVPNQFLFAATTIR